MLNKNYKSYYNIKLNEKESLNSRKMKFYQTLNYV